jgi:hypothetical protein
VVQRAQPIPDATNSWLEIPKAQASDGGSYSFVGPMPAVTASGTTFSLTVETTNAPLTFGASKFIRCRQTVDEAGDWFEPYAALDNAGGIRISTNGIA